MIKGRRQNIRQRCASASSTDSSSSDGLGKDLQEGSKSNRKVLSVDKIRELQKLRQKPGGISVEGLAMGKPTVDKVTSVDEADDPFKMKTGGIVDMKRMLKRRSAPIEEEEGEETIGKLFAAETNRRDEDADMLKYIEEELSQRRGNLKNPEENNQSSVKRHDVLAKVPAHLRPVIPKAAEGMMSQQMLCGIPEVDLGVAAKMANIEATEEAKQRMVRDRLEAAQRGHVSDLVPTNMAVNFVQHSRWNSQADTAARKEAQKKAAAATAAAEAEKTALKWRVGDYERIATLEGETQQLQSEKASDTYHFQKFKKQNMHSKRK